MLKYGFKKEWMHFSRTFRFGGVLIAMISMALANPLMYKFLAWMMEFTGELMQDPAMQGTGLENTNIGALAMVYNDAALVFGGTLLELCGTSLLVIMLVLMSPFGGEQKKRATIIPACSGLDNKQYLLPKFILYPAVIFVANYICAVIAGFLCNALFDVNTVEIADIFLGALLCSIYLVFAVCIYMALGLCTNRPGIMVVVIYFGQNIIQLILASLDLNRFNPFTLLGLISGGMFSPYFSLEEEAGSIIVGSVLSIVIAALMYVLTLAVLNAKKINNQENKPEF